MGHLLGENDMERELTEVEGNHTVNPIVVGIGGIADTELETEIPP